MTVSIMTTKLYIPPIRPELVSRPRLIERLNAGLGHKHGFARKLTLVSAAAGFGKTTLLSDWVRHAKRPAAWLSLDRDDNDPVRFWRYIVAALQTVDTTIGETVQAALQSAQPPPLDTLVTVLINDIATLSTPITLVLDDYHVIEAEAIHSSLNRMLDHLPPQLHLVVATRADPPLFLPRRRGRSELIDIRTADLCFTTEEATEFLNICMGLDLSPKDSVSLGNRTEGWIVGLQMAALSLQGRANKHDFVTAFAGDDRYVGDYLIEEVLRHQPPHVKTFLLQTSILERLCGPLCDTVTETENSQTLLDYLEQANVFIVPLDNRRYWYRYHHLFANLLSRHLRQSMGTKDLELLHLRASHWYENKGFIAEAVAHALVVPDLKYATLLVERHAPDVASRGDITLGRSWLEALPEDMIRSSPFLCILQAGYEESVELAEQWLQDAERIWAAKSRDTGGQKAHDHIAQARFSGWIASTRAFLSFQRGDPLQEVVEFSHQALDSIPQDDSLYNLRARSNLFLVLGCTYWRLGDEKAADQAFAAARKIGDAIEHFSISIGAARSQAWIAYSRGRLRQAAAICQEALRSIVEPLGRAGWPMPVAGGLYIILGSILLEWNDLERAGHTLTKGLDLIKLTQEPFVQKDGYVTLARLKQAQGDMEGASDLIEQVERLGQQADSESTSYRYRFWLSQAEHDPHLTSTAQLTTEANSEAAALKIQSWLSQAKHDLRYLITATRFAEERQIKLDCKGQCRVEQLSLARLLIAQHRAQPTAHQCPDLKPLLQFLDKTLQIAQERDQTRSEIEILVLRATALQAHGNTDQALSALQQALALAEPEGYVRVFVNEGTPMARLLYQVAEREIVTEHHIASDYASRLLAAFGPADLGFQVSDSDLTPGPETRLIEALTKRELEVLHLIAKGFSNREIAQRLVISPGTVKVHASNIYDKLGVRKRTQAVAQARVLGILPST